MNVEPPETLVIIESIVYKSKGFAIYQYMKFNLSLSPNPKTILKVNSVLRIVPQISIYDIHRVHFGRLGELTIPRLRSKLTLCLQPVPQISIYDVRQIVRSPNPKTAIKLTRFLEFVPQILICDVR